MIKTPPQNLDAEMSILGGILIDNDAINRVLEGIVRKASTARLHRKYFWPCAAVDKREPCDLVTLTETLRKRGRLDEVRKWRYLSAHAGR